MQLKQLLLPLQPYTSQFVCSLTFNHWSPFNHVTKLRYFFTCMRSHNVLQHVQSILQSVNILEHKAEAVPLPHIQGGDRKAETGNRVTSLAPCLV